MGFFCLVLFFVCFVLFVGGVFDCVFFFSFQMMQLVHSSASFFENDLCITLFNISWILALVLCLLLLLMTFCRKFKMLLKLLHKGQ